ncbi:phage major capsid protein [Arthrobacter sp. TMP15]|uniref:phage major capsid protein n=1 Tax=Arthrobacter sp. TMP15 TaxID=3140789 RepID=UPI0031BA3E52
MSKLKMLQDTARAAVKTAREIAQKAADESRSLTGEELADYTTAMAKSKDFLEQIKTAKADAAILDDAKALAAEIGGDAGDLLEAQKGASPVQRMKNLGLEVVNSAQFKDAMAAFPDGRVGDKAKFSTAPISVKGLFVGGDQTSAGAFVTPEQSGILEMLGRRPLTIRDLISVRRTGSDAIEYVRQVSHTNAAAPVAEATSADRPTAPEGAGALINNPNGGYRPQGSWAFERKVTNVKTIAEWVPATKRALSDVAQLEGMINDELRADIAETEELQIFSGNGTGDNLTGILNVSGLQSQAFDTDFFTTTRKAQTKARTVGKVIPNAWGMHPEDVEYLDLARENGATGKFHGAGPFAMGPRTLWGTPVIETEGVTSGVPLLGDYSKAVLWDREQTTVSVSDSHEDFFVRGLVAVSAEERVAFGVTRPSAFVKAAVRA